MKWKDIGKLVLEHAPVIGVALGGPAGGTIGQIISSVLGVEEKPEAVAEALKQDPTNYLKILELQKSHELEVIKAAYSAQAAEQSIFADVYKAELQSESWMARNWRPVFGMSVAFSFGIQMIGITIVMMIAPKDAGDAINGMITLIPVWGVALSVLGVNIDRRSEDKKVEAAVRSGQEIPKKEAKGLVGLIATALTKGKAGDSTPSS